MGEGGHKIVKCIKCEKVISQCRCMDMNKPVEYELCDECKAKLTPQHLTDILTDDFGMKKEE